MRVRRGIVWRRYPALLTLLLLAGWLAPFLPAGAAELRDLPVLTNFNAVPVSPRSCALLPGGCAAFEAALRRCGNAAYWDRPRARPRQCSGPTSRGRPYYSPALGWGCGVRCLGQWRARPDAAGACLDTPARACALHGLYRHYCATAPDPAIACGKGYGLTTIVSRSAAGAWSCAKRCRPVAAPK